PPQVESIYSKTVNLPQTKFDQRANSAVREPELQKFWATERIYERLYEEAKGAKFVLHDGPPYANGDLHIGHALNKIIKDFINRYQMLIGKQVRFVPGWDCHGLPIELKILKTEETKGLVEKQKASFMRYGVWGDWSEPYLTLQPKYEAAQIEAFAAMVKGGHIYRGRKPVNWSPSSRTALAEAELEYPEGHVSRSMYAALIDFVYHSTQGLRAYEGSVLRVAVWTTTPWTMAANLAVAVNAKMDYAVVEYKGSKLLVATELIPALANKSGEPAVLTVLKELKGADLVGTTYKHPFYERTSPIVIGGDYITAESGTGLVHTAPGHGVEDYQTGTRFRVQAAVSVDDAGRFTIEAGADLEGKDVLGDGNQACIDKMEAAGALLLEEPYGHKYPYDWRTKKPTIFRATDQWFASVSSFRDEVLAAIETGGKKRIIPMIEGRSDWCISRQRNWGVPIPVFYHKKTAEPLLTEDSIKHVQEIVAEKGTDAWFELDTKDLLPPSHKDDAENWEKGTDTMDVWFDSGSSWNGVVRAAGDKLAYPADMYLEGSDQHRGWFQSSLLTSVAAQGKAPFKTVLTHGFVLDEKGFKMSKSLGNVMDPKMVIDGGKNLKLQPAFGADTLRLWVSSVDYMGDVRVGGNIIQQAHPTSVSDNYRKIRNTLRYIIGNLHDFKPETDAVPYADLPEIDRWMLGRLKEVQAEVKDAFETFQFYRASQTISSFCTTDLSNFYLDVAKDRLYISEASAGRRRACQTVLKVVLETLLSAIAPILPHMAEDAWQNLPWPAPTTSVRNDEWTSVRAFRDDVNQCMEAARVDKLIGASLEAQVFVYCPNPDLKVRLRFTVFGFRVRVGRRAHPPAAL
ncbi:Isoleucyl-tRNA synthetase, partial [Baffinella frigidus]